MIELDAAIIGGGFSGSAVVVQLARRAPAGFALALFEPGELGRGAAYGSAHREHLLNTRAQNMSLFPDDPNHFVRWLGGRAQPRDFVSRRLYGTYVGELVSNALARPRFTHVPDRALGIEPRNGGGFIVDSEQGPQFAAKSVVLATGNTLPGNGFLARSIRLHPGYVADPWHFNYASVGGHVLLIGSGLTALDALVALESSGHRGMVYIVSRHGRFPETHADVSSYDVIPALDARSARSLLRSFRRHVEEAARRGFDWRAVVDAVRPEAEAIWRRLPPLEQRRFERHLRGHWERRRHRAPQDVDAVRRRYEEHGRLVTYAGTLRERRGGIVTIALRDGGSVELRPDWIVNCTGPGGATMMAHDLLLADAFDDGLISFGPGRQGLQANWSLGAVGANGIPTEGLYIVGPPLRGSVFEATAVPELRVMAELAASQIAPAAAPARAALSVGATR